MGWAALEEELDPLRPLFGMVSCFSLNGLSFMVVIAALMSLVVKHIPSAAPRRMGEELRLMAFSGAGAVCGALVVAWLGKPSRLGLAAMVVQLTYDLLIVGFALLRILWLSDILLFFTGASMIIVFSTIASLVQLNAPTNCAAAS